MPATSASTGTARLQHGGWGQAGREGASVGAWAGHACARARGHEHQALAAAVSRAHLTTSRASFSAWQLGSKHAGERAAARSASGIDRSRGACRPAPAAPSSCPHASTAWWAAWGASRRAGPREPAACTERGLQRRRCRLEVLLVNAAVAITGGRTRRAAGARAATRSGACRPAPMALPIVRGREGCHNEPGVVCSSIDAAQVVAGAPSSSRPAPRPTDV